MDKFAAYLHVAGLVFLVFLLAGLFIGVERAFPTLIFCVANLLVLIPAIAIKEKIFASCDVVDGFLVCVTLYLAFLVLGLTALGLLGLLSLRNSFICSCAFFLATAPLLPVPSVLSTAFQSLRKARGLFATEKVLSSFALIFIILILSYRIYTPPAGYDDLMYHLTYPVEWFKSHSLAMSPKHFGAPSHPYLPFNGELIIFWLLLPLKSEFLAKLGQAPFVLLTLIAIFSISRKIGLRGRWSVCCCLLALSLPEFAKQGVSRAGNDIVFTFFFLLSLNFLMMLRKNFSGTVAACFSAAIGLLVGTKSLAVPYVPPLVIIFIYLAIRRKRVSAGTVATTLLIFLLIVLVVGGAGYLRNLIAIGNPLYPLKLSMGPLKIFDGPINRELFYQPQWRRLNPWEDYPAIFFILFSSAVVASMLIRGRGRVREKCTVALISGLAIYILVAFFRLVPFRNTRFLYPGIMLAAIGLSWAAAEIQGRGKNTLPYMRTLILLLLTYGTARFFLDRYFSPKILLRGLLCLGIGILIACCMAFLFSAGRRYLRRGMKMKCLVANLSTAALATLLIGWLLNARYVYEENKYSCSEWLAFPIQGEGKVWKWVDDHSGPGGVTIGYAGIEIIYPFYGKWLRNNAIPVQRGIPAKRRFGLPLDETRSIIFANSLAGRYDGLNTIEKDRINAGIFGWDYRLWLGNLIGNGVEWVLVRGEYTTVTKFSPEERFLGYPIEDEWAKSNPADFQLIYSSKPYRIYKFMKK